MNYKKLIKTRNTRLKILSLLFWIPDKIMLKIQYRIKFKRRLNLKNPKRYTEKIQYYKLYYKNPLMPLCANKYYVREYLKAKKMEDILNECYGIYDSVNDIDFNKLPNKFVFKDTLGDGGNSIIIVDNKKKIDEEDIKKEMQKWINVGIKKVDEAREWVYCNQKHQIICEKYLDDNMTDFKFFCFNGRVEMFYVICDRYTSDGEKIGMYNRNCEKLDVKRKGITNLSGNFKLPNNIDKMINVSESLSKDFPHVRVDLYNIDGKIIFGELTFFGGSGYIEFDPDNYDYYLGDMFNIINK